MKKLLFNTALLLSGLLLAHNSIAQDNDGAEPKYKKNKTFSKSYSLGSSDKVSLSNQFGEMKLITWDKNEVKVDVSITGKSNDEKRAQQILDHINIVDGKSGNTISFKTHFDDDKGTWKGKNGERSEHRNEGMEVNYVVYLPAANSLKAENHFGTMIVPDYRGEAEIDSKFGKLIAGKISNAKSSVTVEFGKAEIEHINGGKLSIKFSSGVVNKLSGDVKSELEFSTVKLALDNDAKNLDIINSYSSVYLDVDKNFSASWDIHTSHGKFENKTDFAIKELGTDDKQYGPRFDSDYKGTSGSGTGRVKINSSFGGITVGHNLQVDLTEKHKSKNKNKNKTTHI